MDKITEEFYPLLPKENKSCSSKTFKFQYMHENVYVFVYLYVYKNKHDTVEKAPAECMFVEM